MIGKLVGIKDQKEEPRRVTVVIGGVLLGGSQLATLGWEDNNYLYFMSTEYTSARVPSEPVFPYVLLH